MHDKFEQTPDDEQPYPNSAQMQEVLDATLTTFFSQCIAHVLTEEEASVVASAAAAAMAGAAFYGFSPDAPSRDRTDQEKSQHLEVFLDMTDANLAAALGLPMDIDVEDDEEMPIREIVVGSGTRH